MARGGAEWPGEGPPPAGTKVPPPPGTTRHPQVRHPKGPIGSLKGPYRVPTLSGPPRHLRPKGVRVGLRGGCGWGCSTFPANNPGVFEVTRGRCSAHQAYLLVALRRPAGIFAPQVSLPPSLPGPRRAGAPSQALSGLWVFGLISPNHLPQTKICSAKPAAHLSVQPSSVVSEANSVVI